MRKNARLEKLLLDAVPARSGSLANVVVNEAIRTASGKLPLGICLAAGFDLLVAAKYYEHVKPENWLWCQGSGLDVYPYLNACPICVLEGRYVYHEGNKLGSGVIGPATAEALREILVEYFNINIEKRIQIRRGREPIDIAIVDEAEKYIFVAEIKASPLFTPPLVFSHDPEHLDTTATRPLKHARGTVRKIYEVKPSLLLPEKGGGYWTWPLEEKGLGEKYWSENALKKAVQKEPGLYEKYLRSWENMWKLYVNKDSSDPGFWLTSACGRPKKAGEGWPQTSDGKPKGSISNGKTSVGMDRTDDIKKSTFQVLTLGVKLRKEDFSPYGLRIGLMSNLHAGRHHKAYLRPYENIVWGWGKEEGAIPSEIYNLFDGIISFSRSYTRDEWLRNLIDWH